MAKRKDDEKDDDMVIVGLSDAELEEDEEEERPKPKAKVEDDEDDDEGEEESDTPKKKSAKNEEEDGDSDEEDERVGHGEDDEEEDEDGKPKSRERESRKARRERQRRARERNELEIKFLRSQNEQLEKKLRDVDERVSKSETTQIDQRITSIQSQLKVADQVLARAHEDGTGEDVVEAQNIRDKLRDSLNRLGQVKTEMARRGESDDEPRVDSRLVFHARNWMNQHDWYNPQGGDKDSRAVAAIDARLAEEGYDPRSPEYWDELTQRVQRRLPHRFKGRADDDDQDLGDEDEGRESRRSSKRGSGPKFSTGGRERPLRKNEVYISPERKKAMEEAGVWDDPVLRKRYLKTYARYDRENPRGQR
jgi:hypothetical protein